MSDQPAVNGVPKRLDVDTKDIPEWLAERLRTTPLHAWLVEAEVEVAKDDRERLANDIKYSTEFAAAVNGKLKNLGITPVTEAYADERGNLIPALLTAADPENELHAVHATWWEDEIEAVLLIEHYDGGTPELRPGAKLRTPRDVVYARHEPFPDVRVNRGPVNLRAAAMKGIHAADAVSPRTSCDADAIVGALGALTAAVLHLADTTHTAHLNSGA